MHFRVFGVDGWLDERIDFGSNELRPSRPGGEIIASASLCPIVVVRG